MRRNRSLWLAFWLVLFLAGATLLSLPAAPARAGVASGSNDSARGPAPLLRPAADLTIYDDALAAGWDDWSWDSTVNYTSAVQVHGGSKSIAVTFKAAWAGLSLHAPAPLATGGYNAIAFWVYGSGGGSMLQLYTQPTDSGANSTPFNFTAPPGGWTSYSVPLSALGNPAQIARITLQDGSGGAQPVFYLDDVRLVAAGAPRFPDTTYDRYLDFSHGVTGLAIAPSGRLYVAVYLDNKVYSWPNAAAVQHGDAPDLTIGSANAGDPNNNRCNNATPSATLLCGPESVAVDKNGNLYVSDTYDHRVLVFRNPETDATPTTADFVLGQGGRFNTADANYDSNVNDGVVEGFCYVRGVAVDANSNVYVVDESNHRVLKFNSPLTTDSMPDLVLGQPTLDTINPCDPVYDSKQSGLNRFNWPLGVAVDTGGDVYVADMRNNRVLRFDAPLTTNQSADQVYGNLNWPHDVAVDRSGNLYVSDAFNNHVLVYADPLTTDAAPDWEFPTVPHPMGLAFDSGGNFYMATNVGDYPYDQPSKLLIYNAPAATATATPTATVTRTRAPTATSTRGASPTATATPTSTRTPQPGGGLALAVDVAANRKPISPYIYGLHYTTEALATELSLPVRRWGGNDKTRYNWTNNLSNNGSDYYFENNTADMSADDFISRDRRTGTKTIMTVPMTGYVAKNDATACGFSVAKYGEQKSVDPFRPDCGNGIRLDDSPVGGNDPLDTSIPAGTAFVQNWLNHLVTTFGTAAHGGVRFYSLDNEPDIWFETHRDIFPLALTYDQYRDRTYDYAAAIKSVDPSAAVLGPVVNGWTYYFNSPRDGQNGQWDTRPDRKAHGDIPFIAWYLQQMQAYEQAHGQRILDYLDVHYYPQADGVSLSGAGDAGTQTLRLRSTRSLWDPTYIDESWISTTEQNGVAVRLIPRLHDWVNANYPGTHLSISEYNWGALDHINGALAQADVLGIFGREGVDLAVLFDTPTGEGLFSPTSPGAFAFRMYRNYDGQHGQFGDVSVSATSADQAKLAVYAAQRSSDVALTLMIVNKTGGALTGNIGLAHFLPAAQARVYRYSPARLDAIVRQPDQAVSPSGFSASFPANSISLVVVPPASGPAPTATPTASPTTTAAPNRFYLPVMVRGR